MILDGGSLPSAKSQKEVNNASKEVRRKAYTGPAKAKKSLKLSNGYTAKFRMEKNEDEETGEEGNLTEIETVLIAPDKSVAGTLYGTYLDHAGYMECDYDSAGLSKLASALMLIDQFENRIVYFYDYEAGRGADKNLEFLAMKETIKNLATSQNVAFAIWGFGDANGDPTEAEYLRHFPEALRVTLNGTPFMVLEFVEDGNGETEISRFFKKRNAAESERSHQCRA